MVIVAMKETAKQNRPTKIIITLKKTPGRITRGSATPQIDSASRRKM